MKGKRWTEPRPKSEPAPPDRNGVNLWFMMVQHEGVISYAMEEG